VRFKSAGKHIKIFEFLGLMTEHRTPSSIFFSKHQLFKNSSNPFGTKRKVAGKGRLFNRDFLPEVRK
jgi:hypothetical protein